ncbi:hypothetical protein HK098_003522 [Nowakowskiella sp. JEL0407]|nr:hypothetical protein HK098_003522 [Nowakowskiella sp. JEL0407]
MENFKRPITLQEVKSFLSKFGTLEYLAMDSCFQLCYATNLQSSLPVSHLNLNSIPNSASRVFGNVSRSLVLKSDLERFFSNDGDFFNQIPTNSVSVADCHGVQRDKVGSNASSVDVEGVVTNMDLDDGSILGDSEPTPTDVFHDVEPIADRESEVDQVLSQELKVILNISSGQPNSHSSNEKFKVFQEIKSNEASSESVELQSSTNTKSTSSFPGIESIKDEPDTDSLKDPNKDEFTSKVSVGTETSGSFPGVENVVDSGVDTMGNRDGQLKVEEVKMESSARAKVYMPGSFPRFGFICRE